MVSLDVIIPSYRLQSEYILPIIQMDIPPATQVRYFIIADNPDVVTPHELVPYIDNKKINLIRNGTNLGVCKTRNVGIENCIADWVLFIDDDVKPEKNLLVIYLNAITNNPDEVGFFGEVIFPRPVNRFTRGLSASIILTFFTIGRHINYLKWAPTPNVLIRRSAIGNVRFNEVFNKFGASEEIDFFLRIYRITGKELRAAKDAIVYHDWWHNGKRNYSRFVRWAGGFTLLITTFPEYTFYNFPNMVESLVAGLLLIIPLSIYLHTPLLLACFVAGILIGDCSVEFLNLLVHKGFRKSLYTVDSVMVRTSIDIGKLLTQFKYHKVIGHFCKRFDHFCDGKRITKTRRWAGLKFLSYIFFTSLWYCLIYKCHLLSNL